MTDREQKLMQGLLSFGWGSHDPTYADKQGPNWWLIEDVGFICPVCGRAAPESDEFPQLESFSVAANHGKDCPLADLLRESD